MILQLASCFVCLFVCLFGLALCRKTKQSLAKLEEVYESTTLEERDTFDEGADLSMQGPILDKLKGTFLKRRHSERVSAEYKRSSAHWSGVGSYNSQAL